MVDVADILKAPNWQPSPEVDRALIAEAAMLCELGRALRSRAETAGAGHTEAIARFHDRVDAYLALHELYRRRMGSSGALMPDPIAHSS
jgi:hypothetical protein